MSESENEKTPVSRCLLVGHCGPDGWMLKGQVSRWLPDVEVEQVDAMDAVRARASPETLMLVNRVLDGDFGGRSGLALIEALAAYEHPPRLMLVSNFADAQAEAEKLGAFPGFGKSAIGRPESAQRVRRAAGAGESAPANK